MSTRKRSLLAVAVSACAALLLAGCPLSGGGGGTLTSIIDALVNSIATGGFPDDFNRPIFLDPNVGPIADIDRDISGDRLGRTTLVGFENLTGFDIYLEYEVNGRFQSVFVAVDETLLLDYGCIDTIRLLLEQDYSPNSGRLVQEFDLGGATFFSPEDFFCGEAFIISIDSTSIIGTPERIDLVR